MKNIILIDSSPKINEKSVSGYLIEKAARRIDDQTANKNFINIRQSFTGHKIQEDYKILINADAVIIAFPLYIFCLPGILMRFLQDYYQFYLENKTKSTNPKVYALVNCGFPEPEINLEAVRVIGSFCRHVNANFRFGIMIGCGGMLLGAEGKPVIKKAVEKLDNAFAEIANDIQNNDTEKKYNILVETMNFPEWIFRFLMNKFGWASNAKKNRLKKKDLYRGPYLL
ncbi:MAG: NAD(P)H-dependent oxidoreductase [Spirochaetes bacterium]|nr:NAD(P)H-dependent oxidoreductase [Spirochaetota bacterium]